MEYPSHVAVGTDESVLERIKEPEINLAIYERPAPPGVEAFLARRGWGELSADGVFFGHRRKVSDTETFQIYFSQGVSNLQGFADHENPIVADVGRLWPRFKAVADDPRADVEFRVTIREEVMGFHHDPIRLRMLCVYQGEEMVYVDNADAHHLSMGNRFSVRLGCPWYRVPRFAVAFFKGKYWSEQYMGLIHSAPITVESRANPRVLAVLGSARA